MFLVGLFSWWYGRGWVGQWRRIVDGWGRTAQFFSIGELAKTLFAPFRQISAGSPANASFGVAIRAFFDTLISRLIGAIVRSGTIIFGIIAIVVRVVVESIAMVLWIMLPIVPIAGFVMFAIGWVPSWL